MRERETKRPKIQKWLHHVNSLSETDRFGAFKNLFVRNTQSKVEKLLAHISIIELMELMKQNSFAIMKFLAECIDLNTNDRLTSSKLHLISKIIFENHEHFEQEDLFEFWDILHVSIKSISLLSLDANILSSMIANSNEKFFNSLQPYIEDDRWLSLMIHDDFELCRLFVLSKNVELTLIKLKKLLKGRFIETAQSIMLALFRHAIKEDSFTFFEEYLKANRDYFSILIMFNRCDLLITACNSPNKLFLEKMFLVIPDAQRRQTLALIATWLSIELNTAQIEHEHLRLSLVSDMKKVNQLTQDIVKNYPDVVDERSFLEAKYRITKKRSTQLSESVKGALLAYLALQSQNNTRFSDMQKYLSNRSSREKHYCIDDTEKSLAEVLNFYFGYEEYSWHSTQPEKTSQNEFKTTLFNNYSQMRTVQLATEISRLQTELAPYRACDISQLRRIALPQISLEEQYDDTVDRITERLDTLNSTLTMVWLKSLDIPLWYFSKSPHYPILGHQIHLGLNAALRAQTGPLIQQSMLVASLGFFAHENDDNTFKSVPVRIEDKTVVKIDHKIDLLTENTDDHLCSHPLKRLINYLLLEKKAINKILEKAFKKNRAMTAIYLRAVTVDCHTNQMPCETCLLFAHSTQIKRTLASKIEKIMISRQIKIDLKNLPLLFRISLPSIEKQISTQLLSAPPLSKLTQPDSQLSPQSSFRPLQNKPSPEDMLQLLVVNKKPPIRLFDLKPDIQNSPPIEHFKHRLFLQNPEKINLKTLSAQVIVLNKLEIQPAETEQNYSPPVKNYTVFIRSCTSK